jgi:hypothetical protein
MVFDKPAPPAPPEGLPAAPPAPVITSPDGTQMICGDGVQALAVLCAPIAASARSDAPASSALRKRASPPA